MTSFVAVATEAPALIERECPKCLVEGMTATYATWTFETDPGEGWQCPNHERPEDDTWGGADEDAAWERNREEMHGRSAWSES